ncbi:uncharacterized protein LOC124891656 [Capsicum annuum]|uniref:uncharacterized protein LOC124891656 n=1 Tax=Capsicum annuum TaxID=4072 RepID=UPI001FB0F7FB|nr:uncharacterized protein LOC124891656 [Capsicum annuum]
MAEDSELMDVILDGPHVPVKEVKEREITRMVIKRREISICKNAKEIWDWLETAYEGTIDMKDSKFYMLTTQYESFTMKERETIQEMHTRFTSITNELHYLGEVVPLYIQVRKILGVLRKSWESKVDAITEERNLKTFTKDELICNLKAHEFKKQQGKEKKEVKREKSMNEGF